VTTPLYGELEKNMPVRREFIAIKIPESVSEYLASLCDDSLSNTRWIAKENLHLTMRFLGNVEDEDEDGLRRVLRSVAVSSFTLEIGNIGTFPSKGAPKVIWVGLGTGHPLLFQLRQQIDDAVIGAGIECEMRDFIPHITIGRCATCSREAIKALSSNTKVKNGPVFSVQEFSLYESRRGPDKSRYIEIESYPLRRS